MSDFDDMTTDELKNRQWELESEIEEITEQLRLLREEGRQSDSVEVRAWVFRACHARKRRREEVTAVKAELKRRKDLQIVARQQAHIQQLVNARFVKAARRRLKAEVFEALMQHARDEARAKLDDNGAPVQAA